MRIWHLNPNTIIVMDLLCNVCVMTSDSNLEGSSCLRIYITLQFRTEEKPLF